LLAKVRIKKITELEQFKCSKFDIGASKLPKETKPCYTSPYSYQQIEKATFQIGADGTDDDVTFKITSDANTATCSVKLSSIGDDWRKNKLEPWLRSYFGKCKDSLYKVNSAPVFSISKNGKDDLVVRSSSFSMKRPDTGEIFKYDCGAFELKGNCKDASFCTKTFNNCKRKTVVAIKTTTQRTTTTKRPTTTKATTIASTTKKKGLLDRILG